MKFPQTQAFTGSNAPFRVEADLGEMEIEGTIPAEIQGSWYRLGPDPQYPPLLGDDLYISGDGAISAIRIHEGRMHFKTRYVQTERLLREREAGRALYGAYRNPYTDEESVRGTNRGTANTTPIWHGGRLLAAKEDSLPYEVDPVTLETKGVFNYEGALRSPNITPHPKIDPVTGELHFFGYECGGEASRDVAYCVANAQGELIREDWFEAPDCTMMHDFAVSRDHVIFFCFPTTSDLDRLKQGGAHWVWDASKPTYIGVMARQASVDSIRWFPWDTSFAFHIMNAFSVGNTVNVDLCLARRNSFPGIEDITGAPYVPEEGAPFLTRITIDLDKKSDPVSSTQLAPMPGDMPRVAEKDCMQDYEVGYYAGYDPSKPPHMSGPVGPGFNHLCRIEVKSGRFTCFYAGDECSLQEPQHIPSTESGHEGYLISVRDNHVQQYSEVMLFEAENPEKGPIAVGKLPMRLRMAFHGNWVASA